MQLELRRLSKFYGEKKALRKANLVLEPGIHALLGPNGAGKSTMMNVLAGMLPATGGEVFWNGTPCHVRKRRKDLPYLEYFGYLPQKFGCYDAFTGMDMLRYFAALKGLPFEEELQEQIDRYVEILGLTGDIHRKMKEYSGGMRQRVGIIQAFLGKPELLILDEPTAGLDPKQRIYFKRMLEEVADHCIVLLSTHILSDVQEIADTIIILKAGRIKAWVPNDADVESVYMEFFGEDGES